MYYSAACTQRSTESRPHNMTMMMMIAENYAQKNALVVGSLRLGWSVGRSVVVCKCNAQALGIENCDVTV